MFHSVACVLALPNVCHDDDARALTYKIASSHASQINGRATVAFKALNELVSCQWKSCAPLKKVRRGWRVREAVHTPSGLYIWTNRASAVVQSNSRQNKIEARGQTSNTISRD